jgi:hypothetical protein
MRKKILDHEKKKSITLSINPHINEILIKHVNEIGINKSKFIETLLEENLKNKKN